MRPEILFKFSRLRLVCLNYQRHIIASINANPVEIMTFTARVGDRFLRRRQSVFGVTVGGFGIKTWRMLD